MDKNEFSIDNIEELKGVLGNMLDSSNGKIIIATSNAYINTKMNSSMGECLPPDTTIDKVSIADSMEKIFKFGDCVIISRLCNVDDLYEYRNVLVDDEFSVIELTDMMSCISYTIIPFSKFNNNKNIKDYYEGTSSIGITLGTESEIEMCLKTCNVIYLEDMKSDKALSVIKSSVPNIMEINFPNMVSSKLNPFTVVLVKKSYDEGVENDNVFTSGIIDILEAGSTLVCSPDWLPLVLKASIRSVNINLRAKCIYNGKVNLDVDTSELYKVDDIIL